MKISKICCIGAGYVGGPTMAVIALKCPNIRVTVVDKNSDKINAWNDKNLANLPVYEPGLEKIVNETRGRNLFFSSDIDTAIKESEMIFMAVNTPTKTEGEGAGMAADLKYVESCAKNIAKVATTNKIVIEKSTLPVRTAEKIQQILNANKNPRVQFEILSNPEFLAEGTAINDLFKSDRVLIGGNQTNSGNIAVQALVNIYSNWIPKEKILTTNVWSSELAKLASNAMLAQRISSINSFSALCEKTGANIEELSRAIGMDHRIGPKFLDASVGFGGSCFQKDILNLVYLCNYYGLYEVAEFWHQVIKINDYQKNRFTQKIIDGLGGDVNQKKIALLGWSFKPNTNDSRESPAINVAVNLLNKGGDLNIYDPKVDEFNIRKDISRLTKKKTFQVFKDLNTSIEKVNAVVIISGWKEFLRIDSAENIIFNGSFLNFKNFKYKIGQ